jgi:hypothetical protein
MIKGVTYQRNSQLLLSLPLTPLLPQLLVSDTPGSQETERITITVKNSGRETGPNTELPTPTIKTAPSPNPTTGRVPNNALNHGSAEVPECAKEADGAQDMTVAKELPSQTRLQVLPQITER